MDSGRAVSLNGELVSADEARVSALDLGFLYGYGLFETMRARSGRIFRLEQHLQRLRDSAEAIHLPLGGHDLAAACYDTLRANNLVDARVRLAVSAGPGEGKPDVPANPRPTILVTASPYAPPPDDAYHRGYRAICSSVRQNSGSPLSRLKSANYLNNLLARDEARRSGADEALLLNERGMVSEGSTTNVFMAMDGGLVTPEVASGCLPGITRQAVIELAQGLGVDVSYREVQMEELFRADEAFLTNSILGVMPLTEVDGLPIKGPGGLTRRLIEAYSELVERETEAGS